MKKNLMIIAAILASGSMAMAQKANVSKASSALYADQVNYDEARAAIEAAKIDPSTSADPKTWYVAGRIGYTMASKEWDKRYLGQTPDADVLYTGLSEMYKNYTEAEQLDGKVLDKKGNPKYTQRKSIKGDYKEMLPVYFATGATLLNNREFDKAYEILSDYNNIADNPMFEAKDKVKIDSTYNDAKYYASYAALSSGKQDAALNCLIELTKSNYSNKQAVYEQIANVYQAMGDTTKYVNALMEGHEAYPQSQFFIGSIVNHYLTTGKYKEALEYVDQVIAKDPNNIEYINVKAELLLQLKDYEAAKAVIESVMAQEKTPTALYLLGKCWATQGGAIQEAAQDIMDNKKYEAEMKKSKDCYVEALKFFEEAKSLMDSSNGNYESMLQIMKALYMQTKGASSAEYQAIDAELKKIQ